MDISTSSGLSVLEPSDTYEDAGLQPLSYDETVPYEEQFPTTTAAELASRIGNTKVYLLSESSAASTAKSRGGKFPSSSSSLFVFLRWIIKSVMDSWFLFNIYILSC
ncbi:hypothetical protein GGU10DRAFT_368521 [Lentinula aff. detonsa]|uniref:Uncharacterized protein n=1 Tax=Lentinula aff. detonsa TaxID=2804958 RepID=A0AA38NHI9_9AGAR|nr:hypothetical protein GGU10DRAFT_368521 [Lentinula aff. detonsa]